MGSATSKGSYIPLTPIVGEKVGDDTYILHSKDIKNLNDTLYYIAKMIQGGLNLANLNTETNQTFTDTNGNVAEIAATALGLSISVENIAGEVSTVSATVDGLSVADETGSYTIIDGDKLKSKDHATGATTIIDDAAIVLSTTYGGGIIKSDSNGIHISGGSVDGPGVGIECATGNFEVSSVNVTMNDGIAQIKSSLIKLISYGNVSIDSYGTIYIGTSPGYSGNVDIGQVGGTVNLVGNVYINGVLQ